MKIRTSMMIAASVCLSTASLFSQTAVNLKLKSVGRSELKEGTYIITQKHTYLLSEPFAIKPEKKYVLTATVRARQIQGQDKSLLFLAFKSDDAHGIPIECWQNMNIPGTFTEVAEDAVKGARTLKVKDGSRFQTRNWLCLVMNAKENESDIPNRQRLAGNITARTQKDGYWELALGKPLLRDIKAGTGIRQHSLGGYIYPIGSKQIGEEWVTYSATIQGILPGAGWNHHKWPKGSVKGRVTILPNWSDKNLITEIRNITLTEK